MYEIWSGLLTAYSGVSTTRNTGVAVTGAANASSMICRVTSRTMPHYQDSSYAAGVAAIASWKTLNG